MIPGDRRVHGAERQAGVRLSRRELDDSVAADQRLEAVVF